MSKLQLSVAMGDYDRTRALFDGRVLIDGVDPVFMLLNPEEIIYILNDAEAAGLIFNPALADAVNRIRAAARSGYGPAPPDVPSYTASGKPQRPRY